MVNPIGLQNSITIHKIPFFTHTVQAGFPSPAEDNIEKKMDLNDLLISHPVATYFVRVQGDSMKGDGIFPNDILIVDKAIPPRENQIVIASVDGDFTVKKLGKINGKFYLVPSNPKFEPILVDNLDNVEIWGVVTYVIHKT